MPAPLYRQIAAELRRRIRDGEFPVDSSLPSRATLQRNYGTSHQVVDKAMIVLWALGYTESTPGAATYVREVAPQEDPEIAAYLDELA